MSDGGIAGLVVLGNVVCALFSAWLASEKNRDGVIWFILGLVAGPIALITLVGAPIAEREVREEPTEENEDFDRERDFDEEIARWG